MRTENLTFYHGTGAEAASAILRYGASESWLEEIGAFALGREIYRSLLRHADLTPEDDFRLLFAFSGPGADESNLWYSALRQIELPSTDSQFEYGHFFATLNIGNAYRYAIGNPYRSEFLRAIAKSLQVLESCGDQLPSTIEASFPVVARMITNPSPPVVLELRGIFADRLLTEKGGSDLTADLKLWERMTMGPGLSAPTAFRVRDVKPADIVAVHDLNKWPIDDVDDSVWQPDLNKAGVVRISPGEWIAKKERHNSI